MKFLRVVLFACISVLLAGCASTQLPPQDAARIRKVGIVAALPQDAPLARLGITVFGNERDSFALAPDAVVHAAVRARLQGTSSAWVVQPVSYDPGAMYARHRAAGALLSSAVSPLASELAALARSHDVDAFLVISEVRYDRMGGNGVGITHRRLVTGGALTLVEANISLSVVDREGKILAQAANGSGVDFYSVDARSFGPSAAEAQAEKERLAREVLSLLRTNIGRRLQQLGL
ncbi:MAG TPA: hypothetical protein VNB23_16355 [Ramlibacter sp.]|nr:hypothetical protein [Ramlibacter sp.]